MKTIISILAGLITAYLIFFKLDPLIINSIMDSLSFESGDIATLVKVGLWVVLIAFSTGITLAISSLVGIIIKSILGE